MPDPRKKKNDRELSSADFRVLAARFAEKVYRFYRYDCCWPYSVAFYVVLIVYWLDAISGAQVKWASILSFGIIASYYAHNRRLIAEGEITLNDKRDRDFFLSFLTFKVVVWGVLLVLVVV